MINGYVNADYAGCRETRKSTTGYIFIFDGGAVSWMSKLQDIVTLSTTEAEYIALIEGAKEMIWLKHVLNQFEVVQGKYVLYCDS